MTRTKITTAAIALSLLAAAPAVAAEVGPQKTVATAGQPSPVTVLGTGIKKGDPLKKGQTMVARSATVSGSETTNLTLTCKAGSALRGIAPSDSGVGFVVTTDHYVGKRSAKLRAYATDKSGAAATGRVFALCGTKK